MLLELQDVKKSFADQPVLRGVSFMVGSGDIVVLLGPSGCGKTTLLRIIAGLETSDSGRLLLENDDLSQIPVHQRGFGMVFQDYALFPHKSVAENVAFGLRMQRWNRDDSDRRVEQVMELVGLAGFGDRRVYELSGGEQQRVALARSLAPSPRLMLLDEPLGSLDRALRERLMGELRSILKNAGPILGQTKQAPAGSTVSDLVKQERAPGMTSIYVTHDQEEAFAIADRVLVMNAGLIEQEGTPVQLYRYPKNSFVARFLGMDNLLEAEVIGRDPPMVRTPIGDLLVEQIPDHIETDMKLLIRPGAGELSLDTQVEENIISGRLVDVSFRGKHQVATVAVPVADGELLLRLAFDSTVALTTDSDRMAIKLDPMKLLLLER